MEERLGVAAIHGVDERESDIPEQRDPADDSASAAGGSPDRSGRPAVGDAGQRGVATATVTGSPPSTQQTTAELLRQSRSASHVHAEVIRYLNAVAGGLEQAGLLLSGVEATRSAGVFVGEIHVARPQVHRGHDTSNGITLGWDESTGWHARNHALNGQPPAYLHTSTVAPRPRAVLEFVQAMLGGRSYGLTCPMRRVAHTPSTLLPTLQAATADPRRDD